MLYMSSYICVYAYTGIVGSGGGNVNISYGTVCSGGANVNANINVMQYTYIHTHIYIYTYIYIYIYSVFLFYVRDSGGFGDFGAQIHSPQKPLNSRKHKRGSEMLYSRNI